MAIYAIILCKNMLNKIAIPRYSISDRALAKKKICICVQKNLPQLRSCHFNRTFAIPMVFYKLKAPLRL